MKRAAYFGFDRCKQSQKVLKMLRKHFDLRYWHEFKFGEFISQRPIADLKVDYIFSFGPLILKEELLVSAQCAAINFHTGPPKWPGRGSSFLAILHSDSEFGVTAHRMTSVVDGGEILKVIRFPIVLGETKITLREKALNKIPELAALVIQDVAHDRLKPSGEMWDRKAVTTKELQEID